MKTPLFALILLLSSPAQASVSVAAPTKCEVPTPDASTLFELIDGPAEGKLDRIREFFDEGRFVAIDAMNEKCETPLLHSISAREYGVFDFLWNKYRNPDVNAYHGKNGARGSIYEYALLFGDWGFVSRLKKAGGKFAYEGMSDLMFAARRNEDISVTRGLLQEGAAVNAVDRFGNTALMHAAVNPNVAILKALIRAGAKIDIQNKIGQTAVFFAVRNRSIEALVTLIQAGADVNRVTLVSSRESVALGKTVWYGGDTALIVAAQDNPNHEMVQVLIRAGAQVNRVNAAGRSALLSAASFSRSVEVVRALIKAGAEVNQTNADGESVLMNAAHWNGSTQVVQELLQAGARVNDVGRDGTNALIEAARSNSNAQVIRVLLSAGAEVNHPDRSGKRALYYAEVYNDNAEVIRALVEAGATR